MNINTRLARLQAAAESARTGKIIVTFKDGHIEHKSGEECINLLLQARREIVKFEAPRRDHGVLPELLTDLLT